MTGGNAMARCLPMLRRCAAILSLCLGLAGGAVAQDMISMQIPSDTEHAQISVKVTKGLVKTSKLPTAALREARLAMQDGKEISPENLRALAEHWDGLAAQKYVRYLLAEVPGASASDIAYFGTIAVSTGRVWTLPDVVNALHQLDPATEPRARIKAYAAMLYPHAWAGNSMALDAVIDLNGEGKLFGPMSKATQKRVEAMGNKAGDGRIPLRLALVLLQKPGRTQADMDAAKHYLTLAETASNLEVKATAENLLKLIESGGIQMASKA
jgi:hypothetical protein